MIATDEAARLGAGDLDDARLARAIAQVREAFELARAPEPREVFSRAFLPPREQRQIPAARG